MREVPFDEFGVRFAAELARLTEGRLSASQVERLSHRSKDELVRNVSLRLTWLGLESVELLSSRGPEEFARGVVREQVRELGEPKNVGVGDAFTWVGDLLLTLLL
jgi:hypothetical protein